MEGDNARYDARVSTSYGAIVDTRYGARDSARDGGYRSSVSSASRSDYHDACDRARISAHEYSHVYSRDSTRGSTYEYSRDSTRDSAPVIPRDSTRDGGYRSSASRSDRNDYSTYYARVRDRHRDRNNYHSSAYYTLGSNHYEHDTNPYGGLSLFSTSQE